MKNYIIEGNKLFVLKAPSSLGVPPRSQQMVHTTDKEGGFLGFRILLKMPFKTSWKCIQLCAEINNFYVRKGDHFQISIGGRPCKIIEGGEGKGR